MRGYFSKVLFVTGFVETMALAELINRFEEYGRIISTKLCLPKDPNENPYAFIEFEVSNNATAARSKLHHSRIFGYQLEVHFETKIPPQFRPMLDEPLIGEPAAADDSRQPAEYSGQASPAEPEPRHAPRYAPRGPPAHERADRVSIAHTSSRGPAAAAQSSSSSSGYAARRAPDDRAAPRYRTTQARPAYRPYTTRREYGAPYSGGGGGHSYRQRTPYERSPRSPDGRSPGEHSPRHSGRRTSGRSMSPARDGDDARAPAEADEYPARDGGRRRSRSRDVSLGRDNSGAWEDPRSPAAQHPEQAAAASEDALFSAPKV
ncbi:hypothetical protein H4R18_004924 [Coemansia javaensis]|uniref:RRM domain-containing protein n=1 Tax=Coemansia javaensis TaxID=2761396 RepID=A0A9W8HA90_9FUNG|nr:hypothetical protein H4R18_004924 [Coemansia javaensis]